MRIVIVAVPHPIDAATLAVKIEAGIHEVLTVRKKILHGEGSSAPSSSSSARTVAISAWTSVVLAINP